VAAEQDLDPTSRLELAFELLRSVMERPGAAPLPAGSGWQMPYAPPTPTFDGRMSATDLLNGWFRPSFGATDPWDDYFTAPQQRDLAPRARTPQANATEQAHSATSAASLALASRPPAPPVSPSPSQAIPAGILAPRAVPEDVAVLPWGDPHDLLAEPEEALADEHAQAAVDTLYDFVHALGRRDLDGAMALVAEDYHTFVDDVETDKLGLRREIEMMFGQLHDWDLDASLVDIPQALFHTYGVLIPTTIGIDARRDDPLDGPLRRSIVWRRLAFFSRHGTDAWLIAALSQV